MSDRCRSASLGNFARAALRFLMGWVGLLIGGGWLPLMPSSVLQAEPATAVSSPSPRWEQAPARIAWSVEARRALDQAAVLESQQRWEDAVRLYDQLLADHAASLCERDDGRFSSVVDLVHERWSAWPLAAVETYRRMLNDPAQQALDRAGQAAASTHLLQIADRWWLTPAGSRAADRAATLLLDEGDAETAAVLWERLAREHPDSRNIAEFEARAAIAWSKAGRALPANGAAQRARRMGGQVRTKDGAVSVDAFLRRLESAATQPASDSDQWPMFGGDPTRNRLGPAGDVPGVLMWRFDLLASLIGTRDLKRTAELAEERADLSFEPVVAQGVVYVQDAARLWAISLDGGRLIWLHRAGGPAANEEVPDFGVTPRGPLSPAVGGGAVYTVLNAPSHGDEGTRRDESETALYCLDARSGHEKWRLAADAAMGTVAAGTAGDMFFDGSPLLYGEAVYVVARRELPGGQECRLIRCDPVTGQVRWSLALAVRVVADSATGGEYRSDPAGSDGLVYVQAFPDVAACVDGIRGRIRWVNVRSEDEPARPGASGQTARAFPVGQEKHQTLRLALDAQGRGSRLMESPHAGAPIRFLDAQTGAQVARVPADKVGFPAAVLGPADQILYGVGKWVVAFDLSSGRVQWHADALGIDGDPLKGRPFLAIDRLYIPTGSALRWISRDGLHQASLGLGGVSPRPVDSGGGNVVSIGSLVLLAGSRHLSCYAPVASAMARLADRVEKEPDNGIARLDLAKTQLSSESTFDLGLAQLDAIVAMIDSGRRGSSASAEEARQLASQAGDMILDYVGMLGVRTHDQRTVVQADAADPRQITPKTAGYQLEQLLRRAQLLHATPEEEVAHRLAFAEAYQRFDQPAAAAALYQGILDDRALQAVPVEQEGLTIRAARLAESGIVDLIVRHGRSCYAAFDAQADALLQETPVYGDERSLRELLDRYPAARCASLAAVRLAELYRGQGIHDRAIRVLRDRLLRPEGLERTDAPADRAAIMHLLAGCYLDLGMVSRGLQWLARGRYEYPHVKLRIDGQSRTFEQLYNQGLSHAGFHSTWSVGFPLRETRRIDLDHPVRLLGTREFGLSDFDSAQPLTCAVLYTNDRAVTVPFEDRSGVEVPVTDVPAFLGPVDDGLLLATRFQVMLVDRHTGQPLWTFGNRPPKADSPAIDPEVLTLLTSRVRDEDLAVVADEKGRAAGIRLTDGEVFWRRKISSRSVATWVLADGLLVYVARLQQGAAELRIINAVTGQDRHILDHPEPESIRWLGMTSSRSLLAIGGDTIACFDVDSGLRLWFTDQARCDRLETVRMDVRNLYLSIEGGSWAAMSLTDGRPKWKTQPPLAADETVSICLMDDARLYLLTGRTVVAVEKAQGQAAWSRPLPGGLVPAAPVVSDGGLVLFHEWPADHDQWQFGAWLLDSATGEVVNRQELLSGEHKPGDQVMVYARGVVVCRGRRVSVWSGSSTDTVPLR